VIFDLLDEIFRCTTINVRLELLWHRVSRVFHTFSVLLISDDVEWHCQLQHNGFCHEKRNARPAQQVQTPFRSRPGVDGHACMFVRGRKAPPRERWAGEMRAQP
jgi:hypothetical protein